MTAADVIALAQKHIPNAKMKSSALLRLTDAEVLFGRGDHEYAKRAAIDSLRYSVGVFHPDYQKAAS